MSRRVAKVTAMGTNKFVYDGWLLVREQSASGGNATSNHYVWGLDLSQSMQGAGGIGGLLATVIVGEPYFSAFDANGNVTEYTDTNGTVVAHYEYDPFGHISAQSGAMTADFAYRFSTKYTDDETGLMYYGYRFYSPNLARFLNRDPIGENGGIHLYRFVRNNPINAWDSLGLRCCVLTWPGALGHSSLKCDNGTYVSKFPTGGSGSSSGGVIVSPPTWHSEQDDINRYGSPTSQDCSDCLDEQAVSDWLAANRNNNYTCTGANCADAVSDAAAAGLGNQTPPDVSTCSQPSCIARVFGGCIAYVRDILNNTGTTTPGQVSDVMSELSANNCQRYMCDIACSGPPSLGVP